MKLIIQKEDEAVKIGQKLAIRRRSCFFMLADMERDSERWWGEVKKSFMRCFKDEDFFDDFWDPEQPFKVLQIQPFNL